MKKITIFSIGFLSIFSIFHLIDLDDKLLFDIFSKDSQNMISHKENIFYFKEIKEIEKNLSGITYSPKTNTLFAISNSPRYIYELDKQGNVLRIIELKGFRDTEDITHIKDDLFAIVDENLSGFYIVKITNETSLINRNDSIKSFMIDVRTFENFGLEGISYDLKNDIFYLVNERNPKKVITVKGFMNSNPIVINEKFEIVENNEYLGDFSAINFDNKSKNIYILSEESRILGRVDDKKSFSKFLDLEDNKTSSNMKNPEGITKDSDGNIYIVGEPNHFLSIKKR
ncbi:SdiA-regulated domain-containing protein [Aliarcobacter cryaerophilus]|uniref:SdiA-regulated domain-containing protein n=2 Tax=Aliarcobacter cryaerophilus TaxID=28198 RepID=UPI0021B1CBA2|nr:SdiA-regulated domain-containing protein [Aliarcobacter cryaerophilus]MCT7543804.1 SdiA-regulated domain-containing protein [Aliarcobacter cryaerophilus]